MNFTIDGVLTDMGYQVTMPDGSVWRVPVILIALSRAQYYAKVDEVSLNEALNNDTVPLFENDPDEIADWAKNNMDWSDVVGNAIMITGPTSVDYEEGWVNGDYEVH